MSIKRRVLEHTRRKMEVSKLGKVDTGILALNKMQTKKLNKILNSKGELVNAVKMLFL